MKDKVKSNILLIKYIYRACSTTVEHGIRIAKMGVQFPPGPQLVNHKIMPDKILTCQNCLSPFVYSEYEQQKNTRENKPAPSYCPICQSLKAQEEKRPKKPSL